MNILAIETSCDETAVAIVKDGHTILTNQISSQIKLHRKYGGVVPELAARCHTEAITLLLEEALAEAKLTRKQISAVAVTHGPGLAGALLVGMASAKALAYALNKPILAVNHLLGHVYANFLTTDSGKYKFQFPYLTLLVSGGHTMLILLRDHFDYQILGKTADDAAGEAFDKVARVLNLGFPGGPVIDRAARSGNRTAIDFPRPMLNDGYGFSYSGLKTAVIQYVRKHPEHNSADVAASFQQVLVEVLVNKTIKAAQEYKVHNILLSGGVAANSMLREEMQESAIKHGFNLHYPPIILCTDNAAMIACAGYYQLKYKGASTFDFGAEPNLKL